MNFSPFADSFRQIAVRTAMANQQAAQRPALQPQADVGFVTSMDYISDPNERANRERAQQQNRSSGPMGPMMYDNSPGRSLSAPTQERTMEYRIPQTELRAVPMPMPSMSDMMTNMYGYGMSPFAGRGMGGYGRQPMFGGMGGYGRQPMFGGMGGYGRQPMMPMFGGGGYGRTPMMPMFGGGMPVQPKPMPMPATIPMQSPMAPSLAQYAQQLYGGLQMQ